MIFFTVTTLSPSRPCLNKLQKLQYTVVWCFVGDTVPYTLQYNMSLISWNIFPTVGSDFSNLHFQMWYLKMSISIVATMDFSLSFSFLFCKKNMLYAGVSTVNICCMLESLYCKNMLHAGVSTVKFAACWSLYCKNMLHAVLSTVKICCMLESLL